MLDGDLQDPPEVIPEMLERWREGVDVVYAVREQRLGETAFKRITARGFYRTFRRLTGLDLAVESGDFRLMDRARARRAARDARAQPLPARDDGLDRLHADRRAVRAPGAPRRA